MFPFACREIRASECRARAIPDPKLRAIALRALYQERGNLEGATAFATFVAPPYRKTVARAVIAFQAAYDYVDAVSELGESIQEDDTQQLHEALIVAVHPAIDHTDYYAFHIGTDDGGYLTFLIDRCRKSLAVLPSLPCVAAHMQEAVDRIVSYQKFNHRRDNHQAFAVWAEKEAPPGPNLRWWEVGAAAGSSLAVFALMSAAAKPKLLDGYVTSVSEAYFPWIGALHTLLDSLIDEHEDNITDQHCLIKCYSSTEETAERMQLLVARAILGVSGLEDSSHMMIMAAMVSFYLSLCQALRPGALLTRQRVLDAIGSHAVPAMLVLRTKATVDRAWGKSVQVLEG